MFFPRMSHRSDRKRTTAVQGTPAWLRRLRLPLRLEELESRFLPSTAGLPLTSTGQPPVANNDAYSVMTGQTLTVAAPGVLGNDTDAEGDPITVGGGTDVHNGTLSISADGSFTYTPAAGFRGTDSFSYFANDKDGNSNFATVSLNVTGQPPVAAHDAYNVTGNTPLTVNAASGVQANDTDAEGDPFTSSLQNPPSNGSLTFNSDGSFTYTPGPGFRGTDTFFYTDTDMDGVSNPATVSLNVTGQPPVAIDDTFAVTGNTPLTANVQANDTDAEGDPFTSTLQSMPSNGMLTFSSNGSFTYTPTFGFRGADSFTYFDTDVDGASNIATVSLNVTGQPPVAHDDQFAATINTTLMVNAPGVLANDTDAEGDPFFAIQQSAPANGALTFSSDGSFTYTPAAGFRGTDHFTYVSQDVDGSSNVATVFINVAGLPPVANNDAYSVTTGQTLTVAAPGILGNDTDAEGDPLTAILQSTPSNGTLMFGIDGSFTYTPNSGFRGTDSFTYVAHDLDGNSNVATVFLNVVGLPPVANNDIYMATGSTPLIVPAASGVLVNDTDAENDALTATLNAGPANGKLMLNSDGSFTYTATAGFRGTDTFTYVASDVDGDSNIATVSINVTGQVPVANNDTYNATTNTTLTVTAATGVLANDTDAENDPFIAVLQTTPANGTLMLNSDGSFTYTPTAGFRGTDSFTYLARDVDGDSNIATVSLSVTGQVPVAVNDAYTATTGGSLSIVAPGVLANDTDAENDTLSAVLVTAPANGMLMLNSDGSFTYTSNSGFTGTDSFTYEAQDVDGVSNIATATITVSAPPNEPPVAINDNYTVATNVALLVDNNRGVLFNDTDAEHEMLTAVLVSGPSHGLLTLNSDGSFTYVAATGFRGTDTFDYQANDPSGSGNVATVTITIQGGPLTVTGADAGGGPDVRVFDASGKMVREIVAYNPAFTGGVRVALGDVNGDGVPDIITAPGPTGGPDIRVFDGVSGALIREFFAYNTGFTGGVFVAAGDTNMDGFADIVTGADAGGGPHVQVFSGKDGAILQSFFPYDLGFRGGVRVAAGDINGDGHADVITSPGASGGPDIRVFSGTNIFIMLREIVAYDPGFTGGVYVTAADLDRDGKADIIVSPGTGGGPDVRAFSGANGAMIREIVAYAPDFLGGVRVGTVDVNGDGTADIVTSPGPTGTSDMRVFDGLTGAQLDEFFAYDLGFTGGVYVGGI